MKKKKKKKPTGPTCPCGYGRGHRMVKVDTEYSTKGWFLLLIGVTATPVRLSYRCRRCNTTFDSTTDPALCEEHT